MKDLVAGGTMNQEKVSNDSINLKNIDFKLLLAYEEEGYIPKCNFCDNIISKVFSEFDIIMNMGKTVAVAIRVDDDNAEFYCKKCYDKLRC